jgi:hypothetical protein
LNQSGLPEVGVATAVETEVVGTADGMAGEVGVLQADKEKLVSIIVKIVARKNALVHIGFLSGPNSGQFCLSPLVRHCRVIPILRQLAELRDIQLPNENEEGHAEPPS